MFINSSQALYRHMCAAAHRHDAIMRRTHKFCERNFYFYLLRLGFIGVFLCICMVQPGRQAVRHPKVVSIEKKVEENQLEKFIFIVAIYRSAEAVCEFR